MKRSLLALCLVACAPPASVVDSGTMDAGLSDAGLLDSGLFDAGSPDGGAHAALWHSRANEAFEAVLLAYWNGSHSYLEQQSPRNGALTGYWVFAQALDLVLDNAGSTPGRYAAWVETFYLAQSARGWHPDYFDDLNWMALALMRAYDFTGKTKYLDRAQALFNDIKQNAVDSTCCGNPAGGLWWDRAHTQKATAINAGAVITALRLATRKNQPALVQFAVDTYAYWRSRMVEPQGFRVWDHLKPDGSITTWRFTYNEGLMLGAALELHRATGLPQYLTDARGFAEALVTSQVKAGPLGDVLNDGPAANCTGDCPVFKGIGFRYLASFQREFPTPEVARVLSSSAESIWNVARATNGAHFAIDWAASAPPTFLLNADLAGAMALSAYASTLSPSQAPFAAGRLEGEEAVLVGVGLEASQAGHTGFGYLAGWNRPGTWAQFSLRVPDAGTYALDVAYSAGAGQAVRRVSVNGAAGGASWNFAPTSSWSSWAKATHSLTLPGGEVTVTLHCEGDAGSDGYLNLDSITVR